MRFLGRKCFVQALLSSGYTFNDKLEQQGVVVTLNTSIKWCLNIEFSYYWQNLEETSTNVLGPIIYRVRREA